MEIGERGKVVDGSTKFCTFSTCPEAVVSSNNSYIEHYFKGFALKMVDCEEPFLGFFQLLHLNNGVWTNGISTEVILDYLNIISANFQQDPSAILQFIVHINK